MLQVTAKAQDRAKQILPKIMKAIMVSSVLPVLCMLWDKMVDNLLDFY
jgi:hypothetical protein